MDDAKSAPSHELACNAPRIHRTLGLYEPLLRAYSLPHASSRAAAGGLGTAEAAGTAELRAAGPDWLATDPSLQIIEVVDFLEHEDHLEKTLRGGRPRGFAGGGLADTAGLPAAAADAPHAAWWPRAAVTGRHGGFRCAAASSCCSLPSLSLSSDVVMAEAGGPATAELPAAAAAGGGEGPDDDSTSAVSAFTSGAFDALVRTSDSSDRLTDLALSTLDALDESVLGSYDRTYGTTLDTALDGTLDELDFWLPGLSLPRPPDTPVLSGHASPIHGVVTSPAVSTCTPLGLFGSEFWSGAKLPSDSKSGEVFKTGSGASAVCAGPAFQLGQASEDVFGPVCSPEAQLWPGRCSPAGNRLVMCAGVPLHPVLAEVVREMAAAQAATGGKT
ncbi:hypothetical protein HYH03_005685 [Edaphochlamys debaryana]|uniref:Uncharacterized protein n=1 Tax=Edaphochlamys debaryana TaxID=47281 RepID=A0A835Y7H2_9CHLO|nr:hypothetical protein HYH03_005685 [Edaphochlamys debaryana]|eukprot:KAG2496462.1 hypothetical protein HYH03_005685 [Edaphochlamys debaryana]